MKKITIFLIPLILAFGACQKIEFNPDGSVRGDNNNPGYNNPGSSYFWPGCRPEAPVLISRTEAPGWPGVFDYQFKLSLNGSQIDPHPLILGEFSIPHVKNGGGIIYHNVANEATYTLNKIEGGFIFYTIRSEAKNEYGKNHTLKYNISRSYECEGGQCWFLVHELVRDNGKDNMIIFTTY